MENSAWFWLMGSNCPLQRAHPLGAKLKLAILISDKNGFAMFFSSLQGMKPFFFRTVCRPDLFQVWDGKIPDSEKIKLTTRNGTMLSCGCDPPSTPAAAEAMAAPGATSEYKLLAEAAHKPLCGLA